MRFGIIGLGVVGAATKAAGEHYGHECVWAHDPPRGIEAKGVDGAQLAFICVSAPTISAGRVDLTAVRAGLEFLVQYGFTGIAVIRSTIPPDAYCALRDRSALKLAANPEFLREREAERCATEPAYLVVGADDPFIADKLRLYYQPWMDALQVPYFETDGKTAWFVKYATNCAIAGQIAVANELFDMAATVGADYSRFVEVCKVDPEVLPRCVEVPGPDGKRGFGGKCLPKDLKAAVTWGGRWEANPSPLRTIYDYNREVRSED